MIVMPEVTSQANAILQGPSPTATVAASATPTASTVPATATGSTPTASTAAGTVTPLTSTPVVITATPIVVTATPIIITATPLTATATPIVVTATPTAVPPTTTTVPAGVGLPTTGRTRRAEIRFMTEAMDTNQIAVDLANDCLTKAQDSQVLALCQQMSAAHTTDIQQLHDVLLSTYQVDYLPTSMTTLQKMSSTPAATMSAAVGTTPNGPGVVLALTSLQGTSYDVAWLEAMMDIHNDLVAGVNRVLNFPINATLRTTVQNMRTTATSEIGTMQSMIARLGGNQ